ncbi:MAG: bifunctional metallophosphatase/5'-nucleotidase [Hoylesella marshii]|uniref:bifunctional metallophosphatase/5'-nucleotidase n=1 Tax=Hoylesella marshii TaxID=189722 RepID=UPI003F9FE63B
MKPRYLLVFVLFVIALNGSAQKKQLVILHTNDTHSCIMPLSVNLSDTLVAGRGGFVRRATMLQEERKKHPDLLLFDSGDFSQGSPYYTLYRGDVEIELMNEMQYTASTVGNHEFDFGMENMARLFRKARFPILCSNYDFTGTVLEGLVKPYMTFRHNGVKIGVFALDPELDGLVFSKNCQGVKYLDPIRVANDMAMMLKKQKKCDVVICISHLGWNLHGIDDTEVIAGSRNIDLVLGGHSHTYFHTLQYVKDLDGREVPVDQNGKHAVYVGKIVLTLDKGK